MKLAGKRNKFSGHWWFKLRNDFAIEVYKHGTANWELHLITWQGRSLIRYIKLSKDNIVYASFRGHIIPNFHSLHAMFEWFRIIAEQKEFNIVY